MSFYKNGIFFCKKYRIHKKIDQLYDKTLKPKKYDIIQIIDDVVLTENNKEQNQNN